MQVSIAFIEESFNFTALGLLNLGQPRERPLS